MSEATAAAAAAVDIPEQIVDYSCASMFEEAAADIEAWLRTCVAADAGDERSAADVAALSDSGVPWCRARAFYYRLREEAQRSQASDAAGGAAAMGFWGGASSAADAPTSSSHLETEERRNCVAELYGTIGGGMSGGDDDESSGVLLPHPIAIHFGLRAFLVVRYDGPSSHRPPEASALLSIGINAVQQAGIALAVFAPASEDSQGAFRGYLSAAADGDEMTRVRAAFDGPFSTTTAVAADSTAPPATVPRQLTVSTGMHRVSCSMSTADGVVPVAALPHHRSTTLSAAKRDGNRPEEERRVTVAGITARYHVQTVPLDALYHEHHGTNPASTIEGMLDVFQMNAGRATSFKPAVTPAAALDASRNGVSLAAAPPPAISGNILLLLDAIPLGGVGVVWQRFVEEELNSEEETEAHHEAAAAAAAAASASSSAPPLDSTTPRPIFLSSPQRLVGCGVPVGTSVCPISELRTVVEWSGIDVESAAVVDNPARSSFRELTTSSKPPVEDGAGDAADATPTAAQDQQSQVPPSGASLEIRWRHRAEVASVATDVISHTLGVAAAAFAAGGADASTETAAGGDEEEEARRAAKRHLYGENVVLPTDERLDLHAANLFPPTDQSSSPLPLDGIMVRFAHECVHLNSTEEMYLLWLRVVDTLTTRFAEAADNVSADGAVDSLNRLVCLLRGSDGQSSHLDGVVELVSEKVAALAECCVDEAEARALDASFGMQSARSDADDASPRGGRRILAGGSGDGWESDEALEQDLAGPAAEQQPKNQRDEQTGLDAAPTLAAPPAPRTVDWPLLCHPDVAVVVPPVRKAAPVTRDIAQRRMAELEHSGSSPAGQRHRALLQAEQTSLVDDMSRFKFLNGGASSAADKPHHQRKVLLADFVRWYSPKDFGNGNATDDRSGDGTEDDDDLGLRFLSTRMTADLGPSNVWVTSWRQARPAELPALAYHPAAEARTIIKFLAGVTAEDIGTSVSILLCACAGRRLSLSRVWRFASRDGRTPALPALHAKAMDIWRRLIKAIPSDDALSSACGSSAAWRSMFTTAVEQIEALDVLTTAASAIVRHLIAARRDAMVDGNGALVVDADTQLGRWHTVDRLVADAWQQRSPWRALQPAKIGCDAAASAARRRVRAVAPELLERLQPDHGASSVVDLRDDWDAWLAWRVLRPRRSRHTTQKASGSSADHDRQRHLTVNGARLDVASGVALGEASVRLAARRVELRGYAVRPLAPTATPRTDGAGEVNADGVVAPSARRSRDLLPLQTFTATVDHCSGVAHFAMGLSEVVAT